MIFLLFILNLAQAGHPGLFKQSTILTQKLQKSLWDEALNDLDSIQSQFSYTFDDFLQWRERFVQLQESTNEQILRELFGKVGERDLRKELSRCGILKTFDPDIKYIQDVCKAKNSAYQIVKLELGDLADKTKDCSLVVPKFKVSIDTAYDDFLISPLSFLQISKKIDEDEEAVNIVDTEQSELMLQANDEIIEKDKANTAFLDEKQPSDSSSQSPQAASQRKNPMQNIIDLYDKEAENVCKDYKDLTSKLLNLYQSGQLLVNKISF
ncbi:unnamed protein product [Blepharisma stoltei]|uniref:Uncharacterized protein n=1 Tax=Blepharisma stoltei TaxID=1481888 RepID=A0AAU9I9I6_9CILI|nr:unnamed protein product [Blepharisma stoltei]